MDAESLWLHVEKDIEAKDKKSCCVCLEDITSTRRLIALECGHIYHEGCDIMLKQCALCEHGVHKRFRIDTERRRVVPLSQQHVIDRLYAVLRAAKDSEDRANELIDLIESDPVEDSATRPQLRLHPLTTVCVFTLCLLQMCIGSFSIIHKPPLSVAVGSLFITAGGMQLIMVLLSMLPKPLPRISQATIIVFYFSVITVNFTAFVLAMIDMGTAPNSLVANWVVTITVQFGFAVKMYQENRAFVLWLLRRRNGE